tara:strand:- start:581 stop:1105 length:525 start_codon:yes stop_codon:yes gene_type:complete
MAGFLELISTTTMTDDVQTVNITNVFSDKYDVYMIKGSNMIGKNSTATGANLRLINSSDSVLSSDYDFAQLTLKGETSFSEGRSTTATRLENVFGGLDDSGQSQGNVAYIFNPFSSSLYTFCQWQSSSMLGNLRGHKGIGVLHTTASITGFQVELNESASRFSGEGKVSVYGVK